MRCSPARILRLAVIHSDYEWDWKKAESEFKRSVDANPNDATAHQWYSFIGLAYRQKRDRAAAEQHLKKAVALSHESPWVDRKAAEPVGHASGS